MAEYATQPGSDLYMHVSYTTCRYSLRRNGLSAAEKEGFAPLWYLS